MITRGQVTNVREMSGPAGPRVQAEVCIASSVEHGTAKIKVELTSPAVMDALLNLKMVLASEAMSILEKQLEGQADWDRERAARVQLEGQAS